MKKSIEAIPTVYRGIKLKSRMEAQCAVLFDKLGWDWKYEPFSLMLPSGLTYIPDFYIEGLGLVCECRGYSSKRGDRQINEFATLTEGVPVVEFALPEGSESWDFMVIGPVFATVYEPFCHPNFLISDRDPRYNRKPALILKCGCGWRLLPETGWCPNCELFATSAALITTRSGKIFFNGKLVEDME